MNLRDKNNNYVFKTKASLLIQALKTGSNAAKQISDEHNIKKSLNNIYIILTVKFKIAILKPLINSKCSKIKLYFIKY